MLVQIRGPVEPGLTSPAFALANLNWLRNLKAEETMSPMVEFQTSSSILGAPEKCRSIIPATYILTESQCGEVDFDGGAPLPPRCVEEVCPCSGVVALVVVVQHQSG